MACLAVAFLLCPAFASSQPVQLTASGSQITAEYSADPASRGLVLMSEALDNPNDVRLLQPLAQALTQRHWQTLRVPMGATPAQATAILQAAIAYLEKQKCQHIILVGHGAGGTTVWRYALDKPASTVKAGILLSAYPTATADEAASKNTPHLAIPVFDVIALHDYETVAQGQHARQNAMSADLHLYRHETIDAADHDYTHLSDMVASMIHAWVMRHAPVKTS